MAKNEAVILNVNCARTHREFYARYDFAYDGVWVLTYGLKDMPSDTSNSSGGGGLSKIDLSNSRIGPQYKCPYCGNKEFVHCGKCKKLTCYSGSGRFVCDHCGGSGEINGTIDSLEGSKRYSQG